VAVIGEEEHPVTVGDVVQISTEVRHRIANTSDHVLIFIEIQQGSLLDEEDFVRIEDDFGRL